MRTDCIEALIETERIIEFEYEGRYFSITYRHDENGKLKVRCGEYGKEQERMEFDCPYDVIDYKIDGKSIGDIFAKLPDDAFEIY